MPKHLGIRIIGPASTIGSFGLYSREIASAMYDAGLFVNLVDSTQPAEFKTNMGMDFADKLNYIRLNQIPEPHVCININSPEKITQFDDKAKINIAWTGVDIDDLPVSYMLALANPKINEIWVPSHDQATIFKKHKAIADRVKVVPFGVNFKSMQVDSKMVLPEECFYFGAVGSLKHTNGYDAALRAFYEEFSNDPDVKFVLKTFSGTLTPDQEKDMAKNYLTSLKKDSKAQALYVVGAHVQGFIDDVIRGLDCLVSPARGKHWNNSVLKAMAAGIPVIVNQHGGNKAYTTRENSVQVSSRRTPIMSLDWLNQNPTHNSCNWFEPNVTELRAAMRKIYEDYKKDKDLLKPMIDAARNKAAKLDWDNVAMQVLANIRKHGDQNV